MNRRAVSAGRALTRGAGGMVVSPHPSATLAGIEALRAGGTAVDAAVAANAVLAVVYAGSCGLGGDAFALVWWPPDERLYGYNGSGRAPGALTRDLVRERGHAAMPTRGPLTITVPGAIEAWARLVERFGRRTLADALLPAADLAEGGYPLTEIMAASLERGASYFDDEAARILLPDGFQVRPGAVYRQPRLAISLRQLALDGPDVFYRGSLGREVARAVDEAGGVLSQADLAAHRGDWVEPVTTSYRDVTVATLPPNSQGVTALLALNVLTVLGERGWPGVPAIAPLGPDLPLPAERVHAQVEALKVAWSERDRTVGDPDRRAVGLGELLSASHAAELASRLDPGRAGRLVPQAPSAGGTVYLAAADADGCLVSLIESNYMGFGSGVMGGTTGIMLQNRGAYFSLADDHPNRLEPGTRTLHTLMPGILLRNGRPWMVLGAMGGDGQPQTMVQLVNALVDDGLDPQQAVDRARWVAQTEAAGEPLGPLLVEDDGVDDALLAGLAERGHAVTVTPPRNPLMGWAQVIRVEEEGYSGGADPRADSLALGL